MIKNPRQADILNILEQYAYASVELLAKLTYASEPTIRRDLIYLESKGYIVRNHGGATLPLKGTSVRPWRFEIRLICDKKNRFAKKLQSSYKRVWRFF